jgi:hypothetical protein
MLDTVCACMSLLIEHGDAVAVHVRLSPIATEYRTSWKDPVGVQDPTRALQQR